MNQPKGNLKIWIPIAAVLCFWLGDWMGYTYELTEGTTTHRLAAALNLNSQLLHPFRLSADAFSLGCGIAAALMAGLIYLCVKYSNVWERNISMIHKKMNMMRDKSICMENRENGLCSY